MKRWLATLAITLLCVGRVAADVTITTTISVEGGVAALAGPGIAPRIVTRIKGGKSRADIDTGGQTMSTIIDVASKQLIILRGDQKTALIIGANVAVGAAPAPGQMPKIDMTVKPTGKKQDINGVTCDEFAISMKLDMSPLAAGRGDMPPEAKSMMADLRMNMTGSVWVAKGAPGAAEYIAFQSNAGKMALAALPGGVPKGLEGLITGFAEAPGIPYLTEVTMVMEGSGKIVEFMKQMGEMKIISRVTSVSTDGLDDAVFAVPEGYSIVRK